VGERPPCLAVAGAVEDLILVVGQVNMAQLIEGEGRLYGLGALPSRPQDEEEDALAGGEEGEEGRLGAEGLGQAA